MRAYFTLVNDEEFVSGAMALWSSLQTQRSEYPLVAVTSEISDESTRKMRMVGIQTVERETISVDTLHEVVGLRRRSRTFSKFHIWDLAEYEKGVFLDADTVIVGDVDDLFDRDEFTAVGSTDFFNTGVFVFEPSRRTYRDLVLLAEHAASDPSYNDDSEQLLLQRYFRDRFSPLPAKYNVPVSLNGAALPRKPVGDTRVLHFEGRPKPWDVHRTESLAAAGASALKLWTDALTLVDSASGRPGIRPR